MTFRTDPSKETEGPWLKEATADIPRVLKAFWQKRIQRADPEFNREGFKGFVIGTFTAAGNEWTKEVDSQFEMIIRERNNFEKFRSFFGDWFTIGSAMIIDRNHLAQPKEKEIKEIKEEDLRSLSEFLQDTNTSAAITLGNTKSDFKTVLSPGIPSSEPFQIHSVTKMFTGMLILKMLEKNIISKDELSKPLKLAFKGKFINSLPEDFKHRFHDHLSQVTLLQLMTHKSGLGDYYEYKNNSNNYQNSRSYQKAILNAIEKNPDNPELPEIKEISDLLQFAGDERHPIGDWNYSNVGITLAALAVEHAHKQHKLTHPEITIDSDYDSLLREYILKEAGIESGHFTKNKPSNGRYNTDEKADLAAPYITAGPAGYYWTTVEDLARFGTYLHNQYTTNSTFQLLADEYGSEFHPEKDVFSHTGTLTGASSAFLSITQKGNIIAIACDNSDDAANSLEARIKRNIFSEPLDQMALSTTAQAVTLLEISPPVLKPEKQKDSVLSQPQTDEPPVLASSPQLEAMNNDNNRNDEMPRSTFGKSSDAAKKFNPPR